MQETNRNGESWESLAYSADRDRGILTPSDREFLLGRKTDYTEHSKKQKRNRIRRRVRNGLLDFTILFEHLSDRDRETVFNPEDEHRDAYTQGVIDILGFLHLGTMGYYVPFKHMLAQGVNRAEQKLAGSDYRMVTVEFNVDPVGQIDLDTVIEKLETGRYEELTDEEIRVFVRLLSESDNFSAAATRDELQAQMDDFLERVTEAAAVRNETVQELGD